MKLSEQPGTNVEPHDNFQQPLFNHWLLSMSLIADKPHGTMLMLCRDHANFMSALAKDKIWKSEVALRQRLAHYPMAGICDMALSVRIETFLRRVEEDTTPEIAQDFSDNCSFFTPVSVAPHCYLRDLGGKQPLTQQTLRTILWKGGSSLSQSCSSSIRDSGRNPATQRGTCCASAVSAQHDS